MPRANMPIERADPLVTPLAASLERRGMAAPALLFVAGHRPLAFAAGHLLAVAAPVAAVLGLPRVMDWSRLLASPEGVDRLVAALARQQPRASGAGEQCP
jgi:hypothetical protein